MNKKINDKADKKGGSGLLKGTLIGTALGVAAGVLLAPESGKEMRADIKKLSGDFYKRNAPKFKKLKAVSEAGYHAFMEKSIAEYAKTKKLTSEEGNALIEQARDFWKHVKKHAR